MKPIKTLLLTICVFWMATPGSAVFADNYSHTISVFKKSPVVMPFFKDAYGYAVFPTVGKGGIVVGGAFGKGRVYRQGILTGHVTLSKVSVGFQLGGQAFSEIIFFQDKRAYDEFTSGTFEFDASASAVVITAGAQAKAGTEGGTASASAGPGTGTQASLGYRKGVAVFVHTKGGLMYEATIGGQRFDFTPL
ncbi:MAG: lipid-binding SYLF domain-containing protein [Desulfotignum sp.]|nr:lipid-binding SYLF domain-containing protein [Desulfotignum sp.]MCF8126561.1 lipid-binding SYLF domain-containing protein [Desulfotignum sp.]